MPRQISSPVAKSKLPFSTSVDHAFREHLPKSGGNIGVAVSGGGDSMALLALLHRWGTPKSRTIFAATVDHGLRPEARAEADFVAKWCSARGIQHRTLTIPSLSGSGNLQASARNARYEALVDWADSVQRFMTVLTAHTMDDQAETVLMRLARGSGAEGLAGMDPVRWWQGVKWIRPLLGFRRTDLREWLREEGVPWIEDPSNDDTRFDRIKARQALEVLGPLGISVEGLAATADRLRRQVGVLEADADELENRALLNSPNEPHAEIDREEVRRAHPDTAMRFLAETIRRIGGRDYRPRFRALEPLYQRIMRKYPVRTTLGLCLVEANETTVTVRPEHP